MSTKKHLVLFEPEKYYHIYNRTNNKELLFKNDSNRSYFLLRYQHYLFPYIDTLCYCLLNTHFHFLVLTKSVADLRKPIASKVKLKRSKFEMKFLELDDYYEDKQLYHKVLEMQFHKFFTSYAMAFNRYWKRAGNLFHRPFKRVEAESEGHLSYLIFYIHRNPVKHGIQSNFDDYEWSSYQMLSQDEEGFIRKDLVYELIGGKNDFVDFHLRFEEVISAMKVSPFNE